MFHRLWLLFAQICTVALAGLFVVSTLRPEWLNIPFLSRSQSVQPAPERAKVSDQSLPAAQSAALPRSDTVGAVTSYSAAVKRSLPAVVSVQTSRVDRRNNPFINDPVFRQLFGDRLAQQKQVMGEGSGAIVSTQGHVLTNYHVIEGATDIELMLGDGRLLKAKVLGADPESDLAVLKVEEPNLPVIPLGNSDALQVGDVVLAMGNPYGISNTVTMGIVSALARRRISETNPSEDFIQTDAAINPGNSGGPLVNVAGELVGINTAIYTRTGSSAGIGFSIPTSLVKPTMEQIIATGTVVRGYLGVSMADLNERTIEALALPKDMKGALVAAIVEDGPAAKGGIRAEDVIVEINGKLIADQGDAIAQIASSKPGAVIPIKIVRHKETLNVTVTMGKRNPRVARG